MKKDVVEGLECPYCLCNFKTEKIVESDGERITLGLIRCRCYYGLIQRCAKPNGVKVMVAKDKKVVQQTEPDQAQNLLKNENSGSFLVDRPGSSLLECRPSLFEGLTAL